MTEPPGIIEVPDTEMRGLDTLAMAEPCFTGKYGMAELPVQYGII